MAIKGNDAFRQRFGADAIVFKSNMRDVAYLSNFYELAPPVKAALVGSRPVVYATVEHYYQASKAVYLGLEAYAETIRTAATPAEAKRLGGGKAMSTYLDENRDFIPAGLVAPMKSALDIKNKVVRGKAIKVQLKSALEGFDETETMRKALALKFDASRDASLVERLLATGTAELGESRGRGPNPWAIDEAGNPGRLGCLLKEIRASLRSTQQQ